MSKKQDSYTLRLLEQAKERILNADGVPIRTWRAERAFDKLLGEIEKDLIKITKRYYIAGAEDWDVVQEGRIAIMDAVDDFKIDGGMSWRNFAINLCTKRRVITKINEARRDKFALLNEAVSLDEPIKTGDEDDSQTLADLVPSRAPNFVDGIILRTEAEEVANRIRRRLTPMELSVFNNSFDEDSYRAIAERCSVSSKAVDNALSRIKGKRSEVNHEYLVEIGDADPMDRPVKPTRSRSASRRSVAAITDLSDLSKAASPQIPKRPTLDLMDDSIPIELIVESAEEEALEEALGDSLE